ncbi:MAG: DUF2726 domain-containing protein [Candidatus Paceibacterota bacterium]
MITLLIAFFILVALASIYYAPLLRKHIAQDHLEYLSYTKKDHLMSKDEHAFFKVLEEAVAERYYIVPKLQLSKLVQVEKDRNWEYAPIDQTHIKSVDFALFNKAFFTPHLVIELDEKPHDGGHGHGHGGAHEPGKDHFLGDMLNKVGIRIVHINAAENYDVEEITKVIS